MKNTGFRAQRRSLARPGSSTQNAPRTRTSACTRRSDGDSGIAAQAGNALSSQRPLSIVEATERWPRAPAPGLRLVTATAATLPLSSTVVMVADQLVDRQSIGRGSGGAGYESGIEHIEIDVQIEQRAAMCQPVDDPAEPARNTQITGGDDADFRRPQKLRLLLVEIARAREHDAIGRDRGGEAGGLAPERAGQTRRGWRPACRPGCR